MDDRDEWFLEPDPAGLGRTNEYSDPGEKVAHMESLVAKGSRLSMINLAHFYEWRGTNGDERCFDLAEEWGLAATKAGSAVGAHWLGCFYVRRKRYEDARRAFMIGEERDYAPSMIRLADYYIKGIGVDRDYSRVQDLLRTASRSGNLWAKRALARTYMNIGPGALTRVRGIFLCCLYDVHFYFLKKISPRSVRLKR